MYSHTELYAQLDTVRSRLGVMMERGLAAANVRPDVVGTDLYSRYQDSVRDVSFITQPTFAAHALQSWQGKQTIVGQFVPNFFSSFLLFFRARFPSVGTLFCADRNKVAFYFFAGD